MSSMDNEQLEQGNQKKKIVQDTERVIRVGDSISASLEASETSEIVCAFSSARSRSEENVAPDCNARVNESDCKENAGQIIDGIINSIYPSAEAQMDSYLLGEEQTDDAVAESLMTREEMSEKLATTSALSRFKVTSANEDAHIMGTPPNGTVPTEDDGAKENGVKLAGIGLDEDYLQDSICGFGPFRPAWLQRMASTKSYVLIYGLIGMTQFGLGSYFVGTISTMEKRFKIPSRTSGLISSGWDVGAFSCSLMISYLGSESHKTRWVSVGTILVGISCFVRLVPHLLYGPGLDALELTEEHGAAVNRSNSAGFFGPLCGISATDEEDCSEGAHTGTIAAAISFFSQVLLGIGTSMYYTLGIAYLDDNSRKNKTPLLLAVWQCLRMLGPTFGFVFASYALQIYIDPHVHPTITVDDPRWIGAWWLGWAPFGFVSILLGIVLLTFPKVLPRAALRAAAKAKTNPPAPKRKLTFKDFRNTMRRLLKNRVLVFNSFSSVCFMFGFIGYWTFMPKYMETQFRQSAATASLITGSVGLVFTALGMITSGAVISKFKPRARLVAGWNVMVELLDVVARIGYAFIGCPAADLHGSMGADDRWNLTAACNGACDCGHSLKYSPVCSYDKLTTFYSACHAGCSSFSITNGTQSFGECGCIDDTGNANMQQFATDGACPVDCATNFIIFLVLECLVRFFSSTGRAGNTIIQFRCVDPGDKSVSIGFTEALLCGLAFIPGPIVYGMILDSSCLVWGETCGQSGNCWLYDGQSLRYLLNLTAAAFLFAGTLLDVGVWYNVKGLEIYDHKENADKSIADEGIDRTLL